MYVPVKGGEEAILNSAHLLEEQRRGNPAIPELTIEQIDSQLRLAVDRVMTEGALFDRTLAALAIKQASGDLVEAIFLVRAYRTTLPRFGGALPLDTSAMRIARRISATFKDVPGGQILGASHDYTQRLLDFSLLQSQEVPPAPETPVVAMRAPVVTALLSDEGLIEPAGTADPSSQPPDLTRDPLEFPASRSLRLQNLARGDEGFLLALGYSTQRGYGSNHPFAAEIRHGAVLIELVPDELGFAVVIGEITVTECQMVNQFQGNHDEPPRFTRGYGLTFGHSERKAIAMALVDRSLRATELGENAGAPAQSEEFVLMHSDNVEASGFVQHLKLPHYVDFQAELELVRRMHRERHADEAASKADLNALPDNTAQESLA